MEYKDYKDMEDGKEPIEKILSDLNGLLNKMPSILSDIKTPDIMKKTKFDYVKEEDAMADNSKESEPQENLNADELAAQQNIPDSEENDLDLFNAQQAMDEPPLARSFSEVDDASSAQEQPMHDEPDSNLDFMASEDDLHPQENALQPDMNEDENPARTGFPPFEAVPSVSALDKEEDSPEEASVQDTDAPDIEALMKLAENEAEVNFVETEVSKSVDIEQVMPENNEQEVETESIPNLSGGVMNLNEENKDLESANESVQNNQDANAEVQPEADLNPADENIPDNEPDDEKTIIASPEDFKTMLDESAPFAQEQAMDDKPKEESEPVVAEEPAVQEVIGEEPSVAEQAIVDEPVAQEQAMEDKPQENIQAEDIQFEATVQSTPEVEQVQSSDAEPVVESILEQPAAEASGAIAEQAIVDEPVAQEQAIEDKPQENIQAEDIQFESAAEASAEVEQSQPAEAVAEQPVQQEPEGLQFESTVEASVEAQPAQEDVADMPVAEAISETAEQLPPGLQNNEASPVEEPPVQQEQAGGLELNTPVELSAEADDEKTIVLEPTHSAFSDNAAQSEQEIPAVQEQTMDAPPAVQETGDLESAEQTLSDSDKVEESLDLVQPQESVSEDSRPEESAPDAGEATIMAAPGDAPSLTNRTKYTGDIKDLIEKQVPEGIPDERIKSLVFLYTSNDETLCAEILNTMDMICLKSETKPMFVKRPVVKVCEPHMRGDSAQTLVSENEAMGIICVGDMPSEMIYDIENVFSTNKSYFQHINKESFNHELIVDLVADLILI